MDREYREADVRLHRLLWPEHRVEWHEDWYDPLPSRGKRPVWWNEVVDWWWDIPAYWTTYAGAGLVIDRMREKRYDLTAHANKYGTVASFKLEDGEGRVPIVGRDTFSEAICAAAEATLNMENGEAK